MSGENPLRERCSLCNKNTVLFKMCLACSLCDTCHSINKKASC